MKNNNNKTSQKFYAEVITNFFFFLRYRGKKEDKLIKKKEDKDNYFLIRKWILSCRSTIIENKSVTGLNYKLIPVSIENKRRVHHSLTQTSVETES